jgi:hypothetical protein
MKYLSLWILSFCLFVNSASSQQSSPEERIFLVIPRSNVSNSKISYAEHKTTLFGAIITFDIPNLSAQVFHVPSKNNHPDYKHEEIYVSQSELLYSTVLFVDQLSFTDFVLLEQNSASYKYYMIFQEDYMTNNRFILNHRFRALEATVRADGAI